MQVQLQEVSCDGSLGGCWESGIPCCEVNQAKNWADDVVYKIVAEDFQFIPNKNLMLH